MALDVDLLLDRRRLKRRLVVWRTLAVVAGVIVVLTALRGAGLGGANPAHIARLNVNGIITEDRKELNALRAAESDNNVKALIVSIDSPGGSVAGGEALYHVISEFAEKKPVVAVMHGLAASAGYMVSLPANRIFASDSTITGSIGVLLETGEVSGLLGKLGITTDALVSGPLKDQPSYTKPLSPAGREVLQAPRHGHVRSVRRHGGHQSAHGPRRGTGAGGWSGLYRSSGPEARVDRCHRR